MVQLDKTCFKIDKPNAKAMLRGYLKEGELRHQSIWLAVKEGDFPALVTLQRSKSRFKLSDIGRSMEPDSFSFPLKYVANLKCEFYIKNEIALWEILCSNGLFDIWGPEQPFNRFAQSKSDPSMFRIQLLRIYEINEEFSATDINHQTTRIDKLVPHGKEVSIKRPIIPDAEFAELRGLLERSVAPFLTRTGQENNTNVSTPRESKSGLGNDPEGLESGEAIQKNIVYAIVGAFPFSSDPGHGMTDKRQKELLRLAYDAKRPDGLNVFPSMHGGQDSGDPQSKSSWGNNKGRRMNCLREHIKAKRILKTSDKRYMLAEGVSPADLGVSQALVDLLAEHTHDPLFRYKVGAAGITPPAGPYDSLAEDLAAIMASHDGATTKEALVDARLGQGKFRNQLLAKWDSRCCVTGSTTQVALRASHIKPWRDCDNSERLDPDNGLPLIGTLDLLFDAGLISFAQDGAVLISELLDEKEKGLFGLEGRHLVRAPNQQTAAYLEYHRDSVFVGSQSRGKKRS